MSQEHTLANLSNQIEKIRQAFNQYSITSTAIDNTVGHSAATGLPAIIKKTKKSIKDYFKALPEIFFGKSTTKKGVKPANVLDYGLIYLTALLASLDLCSIINTLTNLSKKINGSAFNPNETPPPNDAKWKIQKAAYDIQVSIDLFEAAYVTTNDPSTAIINLLAVINPNLTRLSSSNYLGSPEIRKAFPQTDHFNNFIADTLKKFSNVSVISNSDKSTINKLLKTITLVRQTCTLIQGLSSPASLIKLAAGALDPKMFDAIDKLGVNNINVTSITKTVAKIENTTKQIDQILSTIVKFIKNIQQIIRVCLILVKVFKVIVNFLQILPLPNMFTTTGITTIFAKTTNRLDEYCKDTINLLDEINLFLSIIVGLLQGVAAAIDQVTSNLDQIIVNLKSCTRGENPAITILLGDITKNLEGIKKSNQEIKDFIQNYQAKKSNAKHIYHGYTVQILTEEVTDMAVLKQTIPRRYGIAINGANIEVVKTSYTFASDDSIIINEVKLLLVQKGLIKSTKSALTIQEMNVVNEAISALQDNDITMDDIPNDDPTANIDDPDNENDNADNLGINAFFNKLNGGKKMKKKVKKIMNKSKEKLKSDLKNVKK